MTNEQKISIEQLRNQGLSFGKISDATGISVNTVKSFCQRNSIIPAANNIPKLQKTAVIWHDKDLCKQCNKPLIHTPKMKPRTFCNDKCRYNWWNRNRKSAPVLTCQYCGKSFNSYDKKRKFCQHSCYVASRFGGACQ